MSNNTGPVIGSYCKYGCGPRDLHPACKIHVSSESVEASREHHVLTLAVIGLCFASAWFILTMLMSPPAEADQPYGGCIEAIDYPHSDGAAHCRKHGWTITSHIVVRPDKMVLTYRNLPTCEVEDQAVGPCRWNFGIGETGNMVGKAYWVSKGGTVHYVKGMVRR